jgi:hypothetical protein
MEPAGGAKAPPDGAIREQDVDRESPGFRHRPRIRAARWLHPGYKRTKDVDAHDKSGHDEGLAVCTPYPSAPTSNTSPS